MAEEERKAPAEQGARVALGRVTLALLIKVEIATAGVVGEEVEEVAAILEEAPEVPGPGASAAAPEPQQEARSVERRAHPKEPKSFYGTRGPAKPPAEATTHQRAALLGGMFLVEYTIMELKRQQEKENNNQGGGGGAPEQQQMAR